jgi:hypothetical protein
LCALLTVQSNIAGSQHNKPIELWSNEAIQKNLDYLHNNPVESGEVSEPEHFLIVQHLIIQEAKPCWMFS